MFEEFYNNINKFEDAFHFKDDKIKYKSWNPNISLDEKYYRQFQETEPSFYINIIKYFVFNIEKGNFKYDKKDSNIKTRDIYVFDRDNLLMFQINTGNLDNANVKMNISKFNAETKKYTDNFKFSIPIELFKMIDDLCNISDIKKVGKKFNVKDMFDDYNLIKELKIIGNKYSLKIKLKPLFKWI